MQAEYYELIHCGVKQPFRVIVALCVLFRKYSTCFLSWKDRVVFVFVFLQ